MSVSLEAALICYVDTAAARAGTGGNSYPNSQQSRIYLPFRLTAEQLHMTNTGIKLSGSSRLEDAERMTESEEVASEPEETSDSGDLEEEESVRHGVVTVTTNNVKVRINYNQFHASNFSVSSTNLHRRLGGDLAPGRLPSTGEADEGECQDAEPVRAVRNSPHGPGAEADA